MRTIRLTWGPSLAVFVALYGCAQSRSEHGTDSTTHWLRSCGSSAECGGLACVCGVCNTSCTTDAQCRGLDANAVCSEVAASCTDTERSCAQGPDRSSLAPGMGTDSGAGMATDAAAGLDGAIASTCGQPWYQCWDNCLAARKLQGASRTLATCEGSSDCDFSLRLSPEFVLDADICSSLMVELTVGKSDGPVRVHDGTLTAAAWEQATLLAIELDAARATVDAITGCPGCAGVDRATLVLSGLDQLTQTFAYERGQPPAALNAADAFVQALIDELLVCKGPHLADCSIRSLTGDGDVEIQSPEPSGAPLLERPSAGDYTCTVSRPVSTLPIDPSSATPAVAELGGVGHVFWVDGQDTPGSGYQGPLKTASVGLDGVLAPARDVVAPDPGVTSTSPNVHVVAGRDRMTLWWSYQTNAVDPFGALVQLDTDGSAIAPSSRFTAGQFAYDATMVATDTGYAAAWGEPATGGCTLTLAELDEDVAPIGARKTLTPLITQQPTDGEYPTCAVTALVTTPNGYAVVYERSRSAGNVLAYQAFDTSGAPLAPATRLTPPDSWRHGASLLARGDEVLVAWAVMVGPNMNAHQVSSTLRLARFGADGTLSGQVATLAPAREGQSDAGAMWIDLGDQLGLGWTRDQKLDASCTEACLHGAVVQYVVLDAADLTPHSVPVELAVTGTDMPGLGGQLLVRTGDDLLVLLNRWTYTDIQGSQGSLLPATPASAALHCVH